MNWPFCFIIQSLAHSPRWNTNKERDKKWQIDVDIDKISNEVCDRWGMLSFNVYNCFVVREYAFGLGSNTYHRLWIYYLNAKINRARITKQLEASLKTILAGWLYLAMRVQKMDIVRANALDGPIKKPVWKNRQMKSERENLGGHSGRPIKRGSNDIDNTKHRV